MITKTPIHIPTMTDPDPCSEHGTDRIPYSDDPEFRIVDGEKLEKGYTTGACAAGAAKLASRVLLSGRPMPFDNDAPEMVTIQLPPPEDAPLTMPVEELYAEGDRVTAGIKKYAGDDPDVTDGMTIRSTAERIGSPGEIRIEGGTGVGTVTEEGLKLPKGEPAINPVPRKMIRNEVRDQMPSSPEFGLRITISAPGGEDVTEKTYNQRLGIEDGISILGTTGKVTPMSLSAWKASLLPKLDQARKNGHDEIVLVSGRTARQEMLDRGYDATAVAEMSNFVGDMLKRAKELDFRRAILAGPPGKLVKVAAGIANTYSRIADARFETIIANAALEGVDEEVLHDINDMTSAGVVFRYLRDEGLNHIIDRIVRKTKERATEMVQNDMMVDVVYFSARGEHLHDTLDN